MISAHIKAIKGIASDSVNLVVVSGASDGFIKVTIVVVNKSPSILYYKSQYIYSFIIIIIEDRGSLGYKTLHIMGHGKVNKLDGFFILHESDIH